MFQFEMTGQRMNLFICNFLINGYCKFEQAHEVECVFMGMKFWDLKPDSCHYNTLVNGSVEKVILVKHLSCLAVWIRKELYQLSYGSFDDVLHLYR